MPKIIDVAVADLSGAAQQAERYIQDRLGFDHGVTVEMGVAGGRFRVWMSADDAFQRHVQYGHEVGKLRLLEEFDLSSDWDAANAHVWERLRSAMARDERELRFGMQQMGGIIEKAPSFTSAVGQMFAGRIKAARDEATNYMIEHHGWKAETAK